MVTSVSQRGAESIDNRVAGHDCDRALARRANPELKADFHVVNCIAPPGAIPLTFVAQRFYLIVVARITNDYCA